MNRPKFDVFISYSSRDRAFSRKIAQLLIDEKISVWFDLWSIQPGQSWTRTIQEALQSETALFVIGRGGVAQWQSAELQATLAKLVDNPSRRIVPILAPGATKKDIPLFLRAYLYLDLRKWRDKEFDRLVEVIRQHRLGKQKVLRPPKVFLCHAKEDSARIELLYFDLRDRNLDPWYDKEKLLLGDHWQEEIIKAIKQSDFFAVFLSKVSVRKEGFIQKEIRTAIGEYQRKPHGFTYFLPIRLEECEVPRVKLDEQTVLADLHWMDLFENDITALDLLAEGIRSQWTKRNAENEEDRSDTNPP